MTQIPVLETLIDLRPPELVKPTELELIGCLQQIYLRDSVFGPAEEMETLLPHSQLYGALQDTFAAQVFHKRLAYHAPKARISDGVVVFVGLFSGGSPGRAVQWAHAVAKACYLADTERTGSVNLDRLLASHFVHGLPTEAGHHRIWDAQKRPREHRKLHNGSDNWLDWAAEVWDFSRDQAPVAAAQG